MIPVAGNHRHLDTKYLARVNLIVWNPNGIPTQSMENAKRYSSSQVSTTKHVSYPQLTATGQNSFWAIWAIGQLWQKAVNSTPLWWNTDWFFRNLNISFYVSCNMGSCWPICLLVLCMFLLIPLAYISKRHTL